MSKPWETAKYTQPHSAPHVLIEPGGSIRNHPEVVTNTSTSGVASGATPASTKQTTIGPTPGLEHASNRYLGSTVVSSHSATTHHQSPNPISQSRSGAAAAATTTPSQTRAAKFFEDAQKSIDDDDGLITALFIQPIAMWLGLLSFPANLARSVYLLFNRFSDNNHHEKIQAIKHASIVLGGPILDAISYPLFYFFFVIICLVLGLENIVLLNEIFFYIVLIVVTIFTGGRLVLAIFLVVPLLFARSLIGNGLALTVLWLLCSWAWYILAALVYYYEFVFLHTTKTQRTEALHAYDAQKRAKLYFGESSSSSSSSSFTKNESNILATLYILNRLGLSSPSAKITPSSNDILGDAIGHENRLLRFIIASLVFIDTYMLSPERSTIFHMIHPLVYLFNDRSGGITLIISVFIPVMQGVYIKSRINAPYWRLLNPHNNSFVVSEAAAVLYQSKTREVMRSIEDARVDNGETPLKKKKKKMQ